jgi:hypothetical protein
MRRRLQAHMALRASDMRFKRTRRIANPPQTASLPYIIVAGNHGAARQREPRSSCLRQ